MINRAIRSLESLARQKFTTLDSQGYVAVSIGGEERFFPKVMTFKDTKETKGPYDGQSRGIRSVAVFSGIGDNSVLYETYTVSWRPEDSRLTEDILEEDLENLERIARGKMPVYNRIPPGPSGVYEEDDSESSMLAEMIPLEAPYNNIFQ